MRGWTEDESWRYVERFRGHRGDRRCRKCGWFRHMAHHCRRMEIKTEREQKRGLYKNRWEPLRCRVMACKEERRVACSIRREAQQLVRCWGCGEEGHHLWTYPKKVVHPEQEKAQQRKLVCRECKEENHVTRNCDSYWGWREQELRRKLRELKEKSKGEERVLRCTVQPLREIWMKVGMEKIDTHEGVTVKALLDSSTTRIFVDRKFVEKHGFRMEKLDRPSKVTNVDGTDNVGGSIMHKIECNIYYRGHVERMRMDVCNLGQMEVILEMPWLAVHNPEIDWEKGEVKITRCPPMCRRNRKVEKKEMRETAVSCAPRG